MQPPLLCLLFRDPDPPRVRMSFMEAPLRPMMTSDGMTDRPPGHQIPHILLTKCCAHPVGHS